MEAFFVVLMAAAMLGVGVAALLATRRLSALADERVDTSADEDTVVLPKRKGP